MQYSPTVFHHVTARVEVCNNVITSSSSATLKNRQKNSFCFLRTREKVSVKAIFLFLFFQERAFFLLSKSYVPLQLYEKNLAFLFFLPALLLPTYYHHHYLPITSHPLSFSLFQVAGVSNGQNKCVVIRQP